MEQSADRTDKGTVPGVAIDGARLRNIRESKRLTQLYVASVVGVTTDTISRWENNRYPSIKRENAEKLATALEVSVEEITRRDTVEESAPAPEPPPQIRSTRLLFVAGAAGLFLLVAALFYFVNRPPPAPTAVRWAPRYAAPGSVVPVQIRITRQQGASGGFIVKEKVPAGLKVVGSIPPRPAADSPDAAIKWLIPGGSSSVTVYYTLQLPATVARGTELKLDGEIVVRTGDTNRTEAISGSDRIRTGAYHWADTNGDGRIDDDEIMPAYYVCEDMKGLQLDWKTIEDIWNGKGYRWDPQRGFTVLK